MKTYQFFTTGFLSVACACAPAMASSASAEAPAHVSGDSVCRELKSCVDVFSQLTGAKYAYGGTVGSHKIDFFANYPVTKENADLIFTNLLVANELVRIPMGEPNSYYITESKAAVRSPIPVYEGSLKTMPELPNTFDVVTLRYKMQDPQVAENLQRYLGDMLPAYGRATSYPDSGVIVITDSAINLKRIIELVRSVDKPYSAKYRQELDERRRAQLEGMKHPAPQVNKT